MGLLSKIALLLAFLAAFAIPWLGATANGSPVSDGSLVIAGSASGEDAASPDMDDSAAQDDWAAPGDLDEDSAGADSDQAYGGDYATQGAPDPGAHAKPQATAPKAPAAHH